MLLFLVSHGDIMLFLFLSNGQVLAVVSANLTQRSLREEVNTAFDGLCGQSGYSSVTFSLITMSLFLLSTVVLSSTLRASSYSNLKIVRLCIQTTLPIIEMKR